MGWRGGDALRMSCPPRFWSSIRIACFFDSFAVGRRWCSSLSTFWRATWTGRWAPTARLTPRSIPSRSTSSPACSCSTPICGPGRATVCLPVVVGGGSGGSSGGGGGGFCCIGHWRCLPRSLSLVRHNYCHEGHTHTHTHTHTLTHTHTYTYTQTHTSHLTPRQGNSLPPFAPPPLLTPATQ